MTAAETGQAYDESKERFYEEFIYGDYRGADLRGYALDLPRLYVIVSSGTLRRAKPLSMLCGESDSKWCWSGRRPTAKMWGWRVSIWRMERTNTSSCRSLSRDIRPARNGGPERSCAGCFEGRLEQRIRGVRQFGRPLSRVCGDEHHRAIRPLFRVRSAEETGRAVGRRLSLPEISCRPEGMILLPPDAVRKD